MQADSSINEQVAEGVRILSLIQLSHNTVRSQSIPFVAPTFAHYWGRHLCHSAAEPTPKRLERTRHCLLHRALPEPRVHSLCPELAIPELTWPSGATHTSHRRESLASSCFRRIGRLIIRSISQGRPIFLWRNCEHCLRASLTPPGY